MCFIRRNQSYINPFFQKTFFSYFINVMGQLGNGKCRLGFIDTAETFTYKFFIAVHSFRIHPFYRSVVIQNPTVFYFGSGFQFPLIEPFRREMHDLIIHSVLNLQQGNSFRFVLHNFLHQSLIQSASCSFHTFYGRRELAMVSCQDYPVCFADGDPASGFQCLCGFIYK